jgi:hypothetical protein
MRQREASPQPVGVAEAAVRQRREPVPGPILFARYALGPNWLGYCGPGDPAGLLGAVEAGDLRAIRQRAIQFEAAYPYLELIARATGIADPLDRQVVEAYWLGSDLLWRISPRTVEDDLRRRFRPRLPREAWRWLGAKPLAGGRPVHAFHVLEVIPRAGLLRGGRIDDLLAVVDACRIRWGRVLAVEGTTAVVSVVPLEFVGGRLVFGPPRPERFRLGWEGLSVLHPLAAGAVVSVHWDWVCDRLDGEHLGNLIAWTRRQLALANETL